VPRSRLKTVAGCFSRRLSSSSCLFCI
jgi:hypothetical protein